MHNSLFLRPLLREMNAHPLVRERRDAHRLVMADPAAQAGAGEITLAGTWRVEAPLPALREDAEDFLRRLGVTVEATAAQGVTFRLAPDLGARDCRMTVGAEAVLVEGGGTAGLWAGWAWLEFEMLSRRGPFLPTGIVTRRAGWEVQISQGPWGGNYSVPDFSPEYLSDDCFRLYAHYGITSMMIYGDLLCYTQSAILPELNHPDAAAHRAMLQDAARRAAAYGIQFSYLVVGPKLRAGHPVFQAHPHARGTGTAPDGLFFLCSGDETVLAFYREALGSLFRDVPELAGAILIVAEESFYHCKMWRSWATAPCPRCAPLDTEDALVRLLDPIQDAIHAANPTAYVAVWPYTTTHWEHPDRVPLIRQLPDGMAFFLAIEKDQDYHKDGYRKQVWDYSIDFTGPSDDMRVASATCREEGRPLFVKTETGIGLELFQFPYVPALPHLAEKWQRVRDLRPAGVHQSWLFYGMCGSRAEALGLWAAYAPEMPADDFLRRLAVRDFGPEAAHAVLASWRHMSKAVRHLPVIMLNYYYVGPHFLGPCHPLLPEKGMAISPVFDGYLYYLQELGETFAHGHIDETRTCLAIDELAPAAGLPQPLPGESRTGLQILLDEYTAAATAAEQAWQALRAAESLLHTEADRRQYRDECLLTALIYRTLLACRNTAHYLAARDAGDTAAMRRIALDERANALAALPIYQAAPWLDYPMRIDGKYSSAAEMIAEKVRMIEAWDASLATV